MFHVCTPIFIRRNEKSWLQLEFQSGVLSILIDHESCLSVCLFVRVFRSHQKSQAHEILALDLIWANLKHDEA